jgi:hypothetical protein
MNLAGSVRGEVSEHVEDIRLEIESRWIGHIRRSAWGTVALLSAILVLTFLAGFFVHSALAVAALAGAALLWIFLSDVPLTRNLRFRDPTTGRSVTVNDEGVSGEAYPQSWYESAARAKSQLSPYTGTPSTLVVRSRVFRRLTEVSEYRNFVPWPRVTIVLDRYEDEIVAGFWARNSLLENSIFHGLVCVIPPGVLRRFIVKATMGGGDVHVGSELLSDLGRKASVSCPRHNTPQIASMIPGNPPRLAVAASADQVASWFHAPSRGPASLTQLAAQSPRHNP